MNFFIICIHKEKYCNFPEIFYKLTQNKFYFTTERSVWRLSYSFLCFLYSKIYTNVFPHLLTYRQNLHPERHSVLPTTVATSHPTTMQLHNILNNQYLKPQIATWLLPALHQDHNTVSQDPEQKGLDAYKHIRQATA
jgi:hypothetical protein